MNYTENKNNDICVLCRKRKSIKGQTLCFECREGNRQRGKERRIMCIESHRCICCGNRLEDGNKLRKCLSCNERYRKNARNREKKLVDTFKCVRCGSSDIIKNSKRPICEECWYKRIAGMTLKNSSMWGDIKKLLEKQNFKCLYTGDILEIGNGSLALDHIVPVRKGGKHSIENLQWVRRYINTWKGNKTHEEFIVWLKSIVNRFNT